MKLQPLTDGVIDLNFKPLRDIDKQLPAIVWGNYRIAGFFQDEKCLYYPPEHPLETLLELYPSLTLPEIARLFKELKSNNVPFNWELYLRTQNLKWTSDLESLFLLIPETKLSFQNWVSQKNCGLQELQVLVWAFRNYPLLHERIHIFLKFFSQINPSRQVGSKILEYYLELLTDLSDDEIVSKNSPDSVLEYLKLKRFPETSARDTELKYQVQKVSWPAHVQAQFIRNGDRSGVEVKFFSTNAQDFIKKTDALKQIQEQVKEKIWNQS